MKSEDIEYLNSFDDIKLKEIAKKLEKEKQKKDRKKRYSKELEALQYELLQLQNWIYDNNKRVMIIFEGRDGAGKGSTIKRFIEHLNPRKFRIVALPKPTKEEQGQFYFQRYFKELPNEGEIVFFDRSWYNRAIVEPLFGFCTKEQYEHFMNIVPSVEEALIKDGIILIKIWLEISKETQKKRFDERRNNPLKRWKLSPIDLKAQELWDETTYYQKRMFDLTSTKISSWISIDSNNQKEERLIAIKYVLSKIDYDSKNSELIGDILDNSLIKVV